MEGSGRNQGNALQGISAGARVEGGHSGCSAAGNHQELLLVSNLHEELGFGRTQLLHNSEDFLTVSQG